MVKILSDIRKTKAKLGIVARKFNFLSLSIHHYIHTDNRIPSPPQINVTDIENAVPPLSARVSTKRTDTYLLALDLLPSSAATMSLGIQALTVKDYFYYRNGLITIHSCKTDLHNMLSYYEQQITSLDNISKRFSFIVVKVQLQKQKQHYEALYKKLLGIGPQVAKIERDTEAELKNQFAFD